MLRSNKRCFRIVPSQVSVVSIMAFGDVDLMRIEQTGGVFCGKRSPRHLKNKLRLAYIVKAHEVVIVDQQPRWDNLAKWIKTPVAKLKFIRSANKWRLYWTRADMKQHKYPGLSSSNHLNDLAQESDANPFVFEVQKMIPDPLYSH